jgi:hypothetical protein
MTKALFTTPEALVARAAARGTMLTLPDAERLASILGEGIQFAERYDYNDIAFTVAVDVAKTFRGTGPKTYIGEEHVEDTLRARSSEPIADVLTDLIAEHREHEKNWTTTLTESLAGHKVGLLAGLLGKRR